MIKQILALAALAGLLGATPVLAAGGKTGALQAACQASESFQQTLGQTGAAMKQVCGCYVEQLAPSLSDTDVDMLIKGLNGTITDADVMKYETFEDLDAASNQTFGDCMVIEGFADGVDPGAMEEGGDEIDYGSNMEQTDAGPFQATCEQSDWSDYPEIATDGDLSTLCACIAGDLYQAGAMQHDFQSLQGYYDGDLSPDDVEQSNPGLMEQHDAIMNQCLAQL